MTIGCKLTPPTDVLGSTMFPLRIRVHKGDPKGIERPIAKSINQPSKAVQDNHRCVWIRISYVSKNKIDKISISSTQLPNTKQLFVFIAEIQIRIQIVGLYELRNRTCDSIKTYTNRTIPISNNFQLAHKKQKHEDNERRDTDQDIDIRITHVGADIMLYYIGEKRPDLGVAAQSMKSWSYCHASSYHRTEI